MLTKRSSQNY